MSDKLRNVRNWTVGSAVAALILLSPVFAFLIVITAEMLTDLLMEAGANAVWAVAAGGIGWVLFRNRHAGAARVWVKLTTLLLSQPPSPRFN